MTRRLVHLVMPTSLQIQSPARRECRSKRCFGWDSVTCATSPISWSNQLMTWCWAGQSRRRQLLDDFHSLLFRSISRVFWKETQVLYCICSKMWAIATKNVGLFQSRHSSWRQKMEDDSSGPINTTMAMINLLVCNRQNNLFIIYGTISTHIGIVHLM